MRRYHGWISLERSAVLFWAPLFCGERWRYFHFKSSEGLPLHPLASLTCSPCPRETQGRYLCSQARERKCCGPELKWLCWGELAGIPMNQGERAGLDLPESYPRWLLPKGRALQHWGYVWSGPPGKQKPRGPESCRIQESCIPYPVGLQL